ncbi:MAG: sodium:calcium antiporter [Gammaproteobacteria bacterium]
MDVLILVVSLAVILAGSELFTNALEHLGERLGLSTGVTGSILAAVGTALPETVVPLVAIIGAGSSVSASNVGHEIGVGAILGAPLMLATLAFFLVGLMALFRRGWRGTINPERSGFARDLRFFLAAFVLAVVALYIPHSLLWARALIAAILVALYGTYLWRTIRASRALVAAGHGTESSRKLYAARIALPANQTMMVVQLLVALVLIIGGARGFVVGITHISLALGLSPLFLALAIVPFATEMPEKLNSLLWIFRGKDTLAVGNISGAMVFQSSLLPAIGILLTPWQPSFDVRLAMGITLVAGVWLLVLSRLKRLPALALMLNGCAYAVYFIILFAHG